MNTYMMKLAVAITTLLTLSACDTDFDNPVGNTSSYSAGTADFSKFVSLGDSLTAGYADSALYLSGQQNSYPAVLAKQFALVGGGSFTQPLMDDNLGGLLLGGAPLTGFTNRLILDGSTSTPEPIAGTPTTELHPALNQNPLSGSFNNMGVPGAKSYHLVAPGYGNLAGIFNVTTNQPVIPPAANPYFIRFASSTTTTMIGDAATQAPTFFVLWIGNNDILSFATDGGATGVDQTGTFNGGAGTSPSTYGSTDITDPEAFAAIYAAPGTGLVTILTTNPNTKGVLVNIPDVNSIPHFTTVPFNAAELNATQVGQLVAGYAQYNGGLDAALNAGCTGLTQAEVDRRKIVFTEGAGNALVLLDETLTDLTTCAPPTFPFAGLVNMRQATSDDLILITALSDIRNPAVLAGTQTPLTDKQALIPAEITAIRNATAAYNATIKSVADANPTQLALYDANARLSELANGGINYGTGVITDVFGTGGGFSLDGVHPTARGYAVVANDIIDTINISFNASIPKTDPGSKTTIFLK